MVPLIRYTCNASTIAGYRKTDQWLPVPDCAAAKPDASPEVLWRAFRRGLLSTSRAKQIHLCVIMTRIGWYLNLETSKRTTYVANGPKLGSFYRQKEQSLILIKILILLTSIKLMDTFWFLLRRGSLFRRFHKSKVDCILYVSYGSCWIPTDLNWILYLSLASDDCCSQLDWVELC